MRPIHSVVVFGAMLALCGFTSAGIINLNDLYNAGNPFAGTDVTFQNVIESNGVGAATNYFQAPTVTGNTLSLRPENLRVELLPGPGNKTVVSSLAMEIVAGPGKFIESISFRQLVEYSLRGRQANDAIGGVQLDYNWQVLAGGSVGTGNSGQVSASASATPNVGGTWPTNFDLPIGTLAPGATRVRVEFEDRITGSAERTGLTYVSSMQQPGIQMQVTVVPEPAPAILLIIAGIVLQQLIRRR